MPPPTVNRVRRVMKRSDVPGQAPTIPATDDHTDGSWLDTDIYVGELYWNTADERLYSRSDTAIEIINVTGSSTDELVKVSNSDAAAGFLIDKLTAGTNITITDLGGSLQISATGGGSSLILATSQSANYTVQASDLGQSIIVDTTAGSVTVTLPDTLQTGFNFYIEKAGASNMVSVVSGGTNTISGPAQIPTLGRVVFWQKQAAIWKALSDFVPSPSPSPDDTYSFATITVDELGRVTSANDGNIATALSYNIAFNPRRTDTQTVISDAWQFPSAVVITGVAATTGYTASRYKLGGPDIADPAVGVWVSFPVASISISAGQYIIIEATLSTEGLRGTITLTP